MLYFLGGLLELGGAIVGFMGVVPVGVAMIITGYFVVRKAKQKDKEEKLKKEASQKA